VSIEVIMFDLGKVIIDFSPELMLREMRSRCPKPEDFERVLANTDLAVRYESGGLTSEEFFDDLCRLSGLRMTFPEFRQIWASVLAPQLLISEDLLKTLRLRYSMILISNTNEVHVNHIAERHRVFDYFDHKIFSYEVGVMKPDLKIFEHAISLSGKRPEKHFFIDDRQENVLAARQLGIHTHQFMSEAGLVSALKGASVL